MKKIYPVLVAVFIAGNMFLTSETNAQAPQKMSYQAVIRNSSNTLVTSAPIGIRISILQGSSTGTAVYVETQNSTTNNNGLVSLKIGSGTKVAGDFSTINWASGPYFVKIETDPTGGTNYTIVGTSELVSVPYSLFSGNGSGGTGSSWTPKENDIFNTNTGNVGIGTNMPSAKLTIKTPINTTGWTHIGGSDSVVVSENIGGVSASIGTSTSHAFRLNVGGLGRLHIYPTGDVVVGSNATGAFGKFTVETPNNSYGISHLGYGGNVLATYMGGTSAGIGTFSNTNMRIFANGETAVFIATGTNFVGIGAEIPLNKLQIGSDGGFGSWPFVIGDGTKGLGFSQSQDLSFWKSNTDILISPKPNGNVGIGSEIPTNKLQIGSMGATGFATNDFAIGNGTNAMAIYQTNSSTLIGSSTDIILKPRNNGHGRVGINTNTPRAPLDVVDYTDIYFAYYSYITDIAGYNGLQDPCIGCTAGVSIYAQKNVAAQEFDAFSDARIKDIIGLSNTTKDLETLNALKITDYTMKDKVKNGNRQFKKVIAQEVEKIYPQVVSKHTDFIPNVYQLTNKIEKTANGYLLSFTKNHNITKTAKKLQVILDEGTGMQQFEIVSIPSETQVLIKAADLKTGNIFVYGEEVDDFRTVDYEGLTTLDISATQELSKLLNKQQVVIENQQRQIELLEKRLGALEAKR